MMEAATLQVLIDCRPRAGAPNVPVLKLLPLIQQMATCRRLISFADAATLARPPWRNSTRVAQQTAIRVTGGAAAAPLLWSRPPSVGQKRHPSYSMQATTLFEQPPESSRLSCIVLQPLLHRVAASVASCCSLCCISLQSKTLSEQFPERLEQLVVYPVPYALRFVWSLVRGTSTLYPPSTRPLPSLTPDGAGATL